MEFTPPLGRRALILGGLGLLVAGGGAAVLRKLYRAATFSYDGTQYKGKIVQAITPNEQFYCVTKNVIDPGLCRNRSGGSKLTDWSRRRSITTSIS